MYNGLDTADVKNLAEDIILLSLEKDPKKKSAFAGQLELIAVIFVIGGILMVLLFSYLKKEKKKNEDLVAKK